MNAQLPIWRRPVFEGVTLFVLASLSVVIQSLPDLGEALQWRRSATFPLKVATAFTGHLTHWSWDHLLWDVVAFLGLGIAAIRLVPGRLLICLVLSALVISLEIMLFHPQFESYRGLSGIDSALFGLIVAGLWRQGPPVRYLAMIGLAGFLGKTTFELLTGDTLFVERAENDFIPATSAHLSGMVCGLLAGSSKLWTLVKFFGTPRKGLTPGYANRSRS